MPFKSKAQMGKFFALEKRGELPKGTAKKWAHETKSIKGLPERKRNPVQSPCLTGAGQDALKMFYKKKAK